MIKAEWTNKDSLDLQPTCNQLATTEGNLISREDAIRWVKTECNPYGKPTLDFESGKKVIEHLEQMPSAETTTVSGKCQLSEKTPTNAPTDLISREDAIERVVNTGYAYPSKENIVFILRTLPSAENSNTKTQNSNQETQKSNGDLIYRADAIELLTKIVFDEPPYLDSESLCRIYAKEQINTLPSAEVETKCIAQIKVDTEEIVRRIKEEYDITDGWIPCSERLPLVSGEFLVTLVDKDGTWVSTAQWNTTFGGRWQDIFPNDGYRDISNVIAWKTLPTPYKGGEEE